MADSVQIESEREQNLNFEQDRNQELNEEYRVINQKELQLKQNRAHSLQSPEQYKEKEDEINDIKEIEEELKNNLINNNSNFRNPTFEEPSPGNSRPYGSYHANIVKDEEIHHPSQFPKLNIIQSKSHQNFKINNPTILTNEYYRQVPQRESAVNSTPQGQNFAVQDQISMFSSQDK